MSVNKFKTLRHIETVRNFIDAVISEFIHRAQQHDQSKLEPPESEIFEEYTPKLRSVAYNSDEYHATMKKMKVAIDHHVAVNKHHPEHFKDGINDMTLIDLIEMLCDWKASSLRQNDGNLNKSVEINAKRFGIETQLARILYNTVKWLEDQRVIHKAEES